MGRWRRLAAALGAATIGAAVVAEATPAGAAKKVDACTVLTSADISAAFSNANVEPGPIPANDQVADPKAQSACTWSLPSGANRANVGALLSASVLVETLPKRATLERLNTPTPLTKAELKGIGQAGQIGLGTSTGVIQIIDGKTRYKISLGNTGNVIVPIDKAGLLALAEKVAKQLPKSSGSSGGRGRALPVAQEPAAGVPAA